MPEEVARIVLCLLQQKGVHTKYAPSGHGTNAQRRRKNVMKKEMKGKKKEKRTQCPQSKL